MRHITVLPVFALGLTIAAPVAMLSQTAFDAPPATVLHQPAAVAYNDVPATSTGAMTLDVAVTFKTGEPVEGLTAADFKLLDNKTAQNILSVKAAEGFEAKADPPVEVIVVIDAINSSFLTVTEAGTWIRNFLHENDGQLALPTSLLVLSGLGKVAMAAPTRDGKVLEKFLDADETGLRILRKASGGQTFWDREWASLQSIDMLSAREAKRPGRKLVIWVSPGWGIVTGPLMDRSKKNNDFLFDHIVSISTEMRAARLTLYDIDPLGVRPGSYRFESYLKPVDVPEHSDFGNLMLQVLAKETGGQVMAGNNDLAKLIVRCIADAKDYYEVTFTPPPPGHPNELHKVEVQVDKAGLKAEARTRTMYYAEPAVKGETGSSANASGQQVNPASN